MTILIKLDEELTDNSKVLDEIKQEAMKNQADVLCGYKERLKQEFYNAKIGFYFGDFLRFTHDSKNNGFIVARNYLNKVKENLEKVLEKKAVILGPFELHNEGVKDAKIEENKYSKIIIYSSKNKTHEGDKGEIRYR